MEELAQRRLVHPRNATHKRYDSTNNPQPMVSHVMRKLVAALSHGPGTTRQVLHSWEGLCQVFFGQRPEELAWVALSQITYIVHTIYDLSGQYKGDTRDHDW